MKKNIPYLQGLRGIAAFYVVLFHGVDKMVYHGDRITHLIPFFGDWLLFGHLSVVVFIVISGYVIGLGTLKNNQLPGGFFSFIKRRAKRILFPYYPALILSVPFWILGEQLKGHSIKTIDLIEDFFSHVFLVHDLTNGTMWSINGPMWSVAVEWQIYFIFALGLIPIAKKYGANFAVIIAFLIGSILPTINHAFVLAPNYILGSACTWFIGLFGFGWFAASVVHSKNNVPKFFKDNDLMKYISIMLIAICGIISLSIYIRLPTYLSYLPDTILGLACMTLFIYLGNLSKEGRTSRIISVLTAKPVMWLGIISYSLYLISGPILDVSTLFIENFPINGWEMIILQYGIVVPLILLLSHRFYLLFEKPSISSSSIIVNEKVKKKAS